MLFETRMAMDAGVCEKEYGERLLSLVKKVIGKKKVDFTRIEEDAERAKLDKKNVDDGQIVMSVAKAKGEWTTLSMPFEEYRDALKKISGFSTII